MNVMELCCLRVRQKKKDGLFCSQARLWPAARHGSGRRIVKAVVMEESRRIERSIGEGEDGSLEMHSTQSPDVSALNVLVYRLGNTKLNVKSD